MTKYKRIIEEDENGNQKVIDFIKTNETIKVIPKLTPNQLETINQKSELKTDCKRLGGFIHISYVKNELLFNELNLKLPTITRLVYLATYIDYNSGEENVLVKHGKNYKLEYLTRKDLKTLLKLKDGTFNNFLKETKEKDLLYCVDKKYYLSPKYFSKGTCPFNRKEYARIFINTTRELYLNSKTSQHKNLAYVFQLIPYLHYNTNALCRNPREKDINLLEKLSLKDICEMLGLDTNSKSLTTFKKKLLSFNVERNGKNYYLFTRVNLETRDGQKDFFVVNPDVIWKGKNLSIKEEMFLKLLT